MNLAKLYPFAERFYIKNRNDFVRQLNLEISINICSVKSVSTNTQQLILETKLLILATYHPHDKKDSVKLCILHLVNYQEKLRNYL